MLRKLCSVPLRRLRKQYHFILSFCWILGLICGAMVFYSSADDLASLMRSAALSPVSIIGLLCVDLLPFLLSVIAFVLSAPAMLFLISFSKAFLTAYVSVGILLSFGSAGWIYRCFLLFSDCVIVPLLYLYWIRNLSGSVPTQRNLSWTVLLIALCVGVGSIDCYIISPFLVRLIDF